LFDCLVATIHKIEDFLIWQESRVLVKLLFSLSSKDNFSKEYFLKDQIKRASISVMSNIAEGFGRGGNKELIHFLYMANGSLNELKSHLYVSFDFDLITKSELEAILLNMVKLENMIKAFIRSIKGSEFTGQKFKKAEQTSV
jgi:four helix bundle protein